MPSPVAYSNGEIIWGSSSEEGDDDNDTDPSQKPVCGIKTAAQVVEDEEELESESDMDSWMPVGSYRRNGKSKSSEAGRTCENSGIKRNLEDESTDEGSKGVRKKIMKEEVKIILKFRKEDENIILSPVTVSKELKKKVGEVEMAKTLRDGNLLIVCKSEEHKRKAMSVESIGKKRVESKRVLGEKKDSRGVIYGIPVNEDLERLKHNIHNVEVIDIKRLQKTVNNERVDSLSVLLKFSTPEVPERVKVGFMCYPVRPYVPPPLRCYKCQRYGHIAAVCRGKQRCFKCGGEHKIQECGENTQVKCCNCGGEHRATYGGCEVRKKAVEVQKVKSTNNLSYAEALKKVQEKQKETVSNIQELRREPEQHARVYNPVDFDKLILFVAYVINCTDQVKHKNEKIKIIVKGAEKFLGMRNMSLDQVIQKLEADGNKPK